ncbi:MAG: flagellar motor switch protein FliG [Salinisphaera sp.]|jgi:flagellar motor switch protein FliG|nr:flagellar motor switch protein FliG [Salinisphaera sp.]
MADMDMNKDGLERSAILMMALNEDVAAEIFKHLTAAEAQRLGSQMASLKNIANDRVHAVLSQFNDEVGDLGVVNLDGGDHIRAVLTKAMGEERAASLLEDIFEASPSSGIDALNLMEASVVAELIRDEHPQIVATIIVHLERPRAAEIINCFNEPLRNDVLLRVATFSGVQPAALAELTQVLSGLLSGQNMKRSKMGGINTAAEILNLMPSSQEESVIASMRAHDETLAQRIVDEMFVFEDLARVDDRAIKRLLQDIDTATLAAALKGTSEALFGRFTSNMANRAADLLREDMEMRGPLRLSVVEAERKKILQTVRRLADSGEIALGGDGEEYV